MKKICLLFCLVFSFLIFKLDVFAQITYDITSLNVQDNNISLSGWGRIRKRHNGRNTLNGDYLFSPTYHFYLIKEGTNKIASDTPVSRYVKYHYEGNSGFSLTESIYVKSGTQRAYGKNCTNNINCSRYANDYDQFVQYQNRGQYFYDNVDFEVNFDNLDTLESGKYRIEMEIEVPNVDNNGNINGTYKESVPNPLYIYKGNCTNLESSNLKVSNLTDNVLMAASDGRLQEKTVLANGFENLQSIGRAIFIDNEIYKVNQYKKNMISKPYDDQTSIEVWEHIYSKRSKDSNVSYSGYQLVLDGKYKCLSGGCNFHLGSLSTAWAASEWVVPYGDAYLLIEKKRSLQRSRIYI